MLIAKDILSDQIVCKLTDTLSVTQLDTLQRAATKVTGIGIESDKNIIYLQRILSGS